MKSQCFKEYICESGYGDKKMRRLLYVSIVLVMLTIIGLSLNHYLVSKSSDRSEEEIIKIFESDADYKFIGETLVRYKEKININDENGKIIIECSTLEVKQGIEGNRELIECIERVFDSEEVYNISLYEESVYFDLSRPLDDHHGSFIYDPLKKLQGSRIHLTPIDDDWLLEMIPNL